MPKLNFFLIIVLLAIFSFGCAAKDSRVVININQKKIIVETAVSETDKIKGLSGRDDLAENSGMLFVYDTYQQPDFWMKNMQFSIDIIWIKDQKIVGWVKNLPPEGNKPEKIYTAPEPINYVLEVGAGFVERNNIKAGDTVMISDR